MAALYHLHVGARRCGCYPTLATALERARREAGGGEEWFVLQVADGVTGAVECAAHGTGPSEGATAALAGRVRDRGPRPPRRDWSLTRF